MPAAGDAHSLPSADAASAARARRLRSFRLLTAVLVTGVALATLGLAEKLLRGREAKLRASDRLEPGLIRPDPHLGWRLAPLARVRHEHHDFQATYGVSAAGFRTDAEIPPVRSGPVHALFGDSFTFGLGVNDRATFVACLNRQAGGRAHFLNCGVPGYSTDQEILLLEEQISVLRPEAVWVVVYLGNDLLDNPTALPMQVRLPKPRFEMRQGSLHLTAPILTAATLPAGGTAPSDMAAAILGPDSAAADWRTRWQRRSAVFQVIDQRILPQRDHRVQIRTRLNPSVDLAWAILDRGRAACRQRGISFGIVLLAGRTWITQPQSLSGQYQEFARAALLAKCQAENCPVIDLGAALRARSGAGDLFFPHDGHLNAAGHEAAAMLLAEAMRGAPAR